MRAWIVLRCYDHVREYQSEHRIFKPVAHNSTTFAQPLKPVPRHEFERLTAEHRSGRSPQWYGL